MCLSSWWRNPWEFWSFKTQALTRTVLLCRHSQLHILLVLLTWFRSCLQWMDSLLLPQSALSPTSVLCCVVCILRDQKWRLCNYSINHVPPFNLHSWRQQLVCLNTVGVFRGWIGHSCCYGISGWIEMFLLTGRRASLQPQPIKIVSIPLLQEKQNPNYSKHHQKLLDYSQASSASSFPIHLM